MKATLAEHGAHFDALYRASPDPWDYYKSPIEASKRRAILTAIGSGPVGCGLELGCGNGRTTAALTARFTQLLAVDGSAEAIELARRCVPETRHLHFRQARLPDEFPQGTFDVIIASEVLYYLPRFALRATLARIGASLRSSGRLIVVGALGGFSDRELGHLELFEILRCDFGAPIQTKVGAGWRLDRFG